MHKLAQSVIDACIDAIKVIVGIGNFDDVPTVKIALFTNDVTPSRFSTFADFDLATFTGSAPKDFGLELAAVSYTDPLTGERLLQMVPNNTSSAWVCTVTPVAPEIIYGYIITNADGDEYLGGDKFETPITINAAGQGIDVPDVISRFSATLGLVA